MEEFNERDLFAALVMCGLAANKGLAMGADMYAEISYKIADRMLLEKEKCDERAGD